MSSALTERITGKDLLVTSILCLGNLMLLLNCSLDCNLNVCQSTFKGLRRLFSERDVHNEFCVTQQYSWKNWLPFLFPALLKHTLFPALSVHMPGTCFSSEENICLFDVSGRVCFHNYIMWQWQWLENKAINIQRAKNCCHRISLNCCHSLVQYKPLH